MRVLRSIAALIVGYAVIVILTTYGFRFALDGQKIYGSGAFVMLKGTLVTLIAGMAGGYVAGLIGSLRPTASAVLVLLPLITESTYLLVFRRLDAPLWFEIIGVLTLLGATLVGGMLREITSTRPGLPRPSSSLSL